MIDLVTRSATPGKWRPGPQRTQYKEYARSALAAGFTTAPTTDRSATLMCMVNPTNPTGDYWGIEKMKAFIEGGCDAGTTVIVGERGRVVAGGVIDLKGEERGCFLDRNERYG